MLNLEYLEQLPLKIPAELPILPMRDIVAFPHLALPLFVGREKSARAIEHGLHAEKLLFLVAQKELNMQNPLPEDLYVIGTVGIIVRTLPVNEQGANMKILVQGLYRARITHFVQTEPFFMVTLEKEDIRESALNNPKAGQLIGEIKKKLNELVFKYRKQFPMEVMSAIESMTDDRKIAFYIASNLGLKVSIAQTILEITNPAQRLLYLRTILGNEIKILSIKKAQRG